MADITQLIGNTPLVRLEGLSRRSGATVLAKLEMFNPGGSVKDRTAWALIRDAAERGLIGPGTVLIEATSGNTGVALAMVAASRGLTLRLCMPEGQSLERRQLFMAYGAGLEETPRAEGTPGAIRRARELEQALPHGLWLRQHSNPANPRVHEETTGPEIWRDTGGAVDLVVAGVGTGGTLTGIGRYLKARKPAVRMIAVEPAASAVLSGRPRGPHRIQGIGAGFVPEVLDTGLIDRVVAVEDEEAWAAARWLPRHEGVLAGLSSGAAYAALEKVLQEEGGRGRTCVVIFPDSGERYLSLGLYQPG